MLQSIRLWIILAVLAGGSVGAWWLWGRSADGAVGIQIESTQAASGDVRRIVAASGAVRALVTVEVGSQVSGQIAELSVDFNDAVEVGQLIARINPETFETRVTEARASRDVAAANLALQQASADRVRANLRAAQLDLDRVRTLHERGNASQAALDNAEASFDAQSADLAVAQAQIANARASLTQRVATLDGALIDLERTEIRSPINGVVVDRAVDAGQTVAASLSAPTLFTIAQDLSEIQIDAQIDEADIGQISRGQSVTFTVDAYPGLEMEGVVEQIRLAPTTLQNIVTYTVVVSASNPGQRLLPGMTANMDIITGERTDVLTVPNSALRFRPSPALASRTVALDNEAGQGRAGGGRPGGGSGMLDRMLAGLDVTAEQREEIGTGMRRIFGRLQGAGGPPDREAIGREIESLMQGILTPEQMQAYREQRRLARETRMVTVWVEREDGQLEERRVRVGIGDSSITEVVGGQLEAGERVVTRAREVRS
ncbi:efflux RND transporter periplasmic adaptor subunit [Maricaulis sp. D1M11]|uniref:efflux RND transporter periplasmic adaptor subunit n=1 Tax=Maricaulis sp. D1M11 TaxID=3076117 RepID=UPI0039B3DE08